MLPTTSTDTHHVAGVWSRLWEEDPLNSGQFDRETLVHWTQAPCGIYVDIRLPITAPGRSLQAAEGYERNPLGLLANGSFTPAKDKNHLDIFLGQKSFAGTLFFAFGDTTDDGAALAKDTALAELASSPTAAIPLCTCFWRRDIDFQPPSGGLDVGVCASGPLQQPDETIDMRETGDDASYAELWHRMAKTKDENVYCALELVEENGLTDARKGYWVRTGDRFAYAIGRPLTEAACTALGCPPASHTIVDQVGKSLAQTVADKEDDLAQVMSYVAVVGTVRSDGSWYIESSTRPDLVGCTLLGDGDDAASCCSNLSGDANDGHIIRQTLLGSNNCVRKWRVAEIKGFEFPLCE